MANVETNTNSSPSFWAAPKKGAKKDAPVEPETVVEVGASSSEPQRVIRRAPSKGPQPRKAPVAQPTPAPAPEPASVMDTVMNTAGQIVVEQPVAPTVLYKKVPAPDAILSAAVLEDDTPRMRADKLKAMADAADAHARLADFGIRNNKFLLVNDPSVCRYNISNSNQSNGVKSQTNNNDEYYDEEVEGGRRGFGRIAFWTALVTVAVMAGIGAVLWFFVLKK